MNCDAFLQWMKSHTGQGMSKNPEVTAHLGSCPACRQIFSLDACLEAVIQQAFTPHSLPADLVETIDACLDRINHAHPSMNFPGHAQEPTVETADPFSRKGAVKKTGPVKKSFQK
ncbi:MAG: hypothetical protein RQ739_01810 [Desulfotignum sp.]|nr:hypothetical protein [Desulfotignum sp.]